MAEDRSISPAPERDGQGRISTRWPVIIISLAVLLLGGISVAIYALTADQRPGGDPGGTVLRSLETIRSAVPLGATDVSTLTVPSTWLGACGGDPGSHGGWTEDRSSAQFTETAPPDTVKAAVGRVLMAQGWVRHDMVITPGQGPTAHWSRPVRDGRPADAFVFPTPPGSTAWSLTATWRPPGPVGDCP